MKRHICLPENSLWDIFVNLPKYILLYKNFSLEIYVGQ